ncbi:ABC transporter ATP-binding protein [Umezawaea tangerina]|uniref:Putative ABC transport system ATP-binding protein n=1 Tax=Umezawaea tangerina TaxID=84725 RepID=A0A2T0T6L1_9PSEU|nr:ABC transporter ATP-binding protein [Umezawaea tangerina]PRY41296.1 putative ABC transport system ATP-binding protein [Umezawaea tangerina]
MPTPAVVATGLRKVYGRGPTEVHALRDVDLTIHKGQLTAIMGPSGSGKSSLMHCLAGLDRPSAGTVTVEGTDLTGLDERRRTDLRRDRIGFVFQQYNLLPELSGRDNVLLPLEIAGRRTDRAWFDRIVAALGIGPHLDRRPTELSGGQQQRIAIARALITRPAVVFADEPTGNLDSAASRDVLELLRRSTGSLGRTVVVVTHDPVAAGYADRVVLLADGRVAGELHGSTSQDIAVEPEKLAG